MSCVHRRVYFFFCFFLIIKWMKTDQLNEFKEGTSFTCRWRSSHSPPDPSPTHVQTLHVWESTGSKKKKNRYILVRKCIWFVFVLLHFLLPPPACVYFPWLGPLSLRPHFTPPVRAKRSVGSQRSCAVMAFIHDAKFILQWMTVMGRNTLITVIAVMEVLLPWLPPCLSLIYFLLHTLSTTASWVDVPHTIGF